MRARATEKKHEFCAANDCAKKDRPKAWENRTRTKRSGWEIPVAAVVLRCWRPQQPNHACSVQRALKIRTTAASWPSNCRFLARLWPCDYAVCVSSSKDIAPPTIVLAGGGTGGHIYPNIAIAERIERLIPEAKILFVVSSRPSDATIMAKFRYPFVSTDITPLPPVKKPWKLLGFAKRWLSASKQAADILRECNATCLVTSGGFVSGPMMVAASRLSIPRAMLNLDAVPGKANRQLVRYAQEIYSVHACDLLPNAKIVGLPLRAASMGLQTPVEQAREALGLNPDKRTLFVTGATHGATSIIEAMIELIKIPEAREILSQWQILHQCGSYDVQALARAYDESKIQAKVVAFCDQMGLAWRSASLAISRAGAGSVAEAWANHTPTLFLPNPYHDDGHQRKNAAAMVASGAAKVLEDVINPIENSRALLAILRTYCAGPQEEATMRAALVDQTPVDGALDLANWCVRQTSKT